MGYGALQSHAAAGTGHGPRGAPAALLIREAIRAHEPVLDLPRWRALCIGLAVGAAGDLSRDARLLVAEVPAPRHTKVG